jgi:hypothetical protein
VKPCLARLRARLTERGPWAAATSGCGPLPSPAELVAQLREAGFEEAKAERLLPGESYFAFTGRAR